MGIKSVAGVCAVGMLIMQLGILSKTCNSYASNIYDNGVYSNLDNSYISKKIYRLNITGKEGNVNISDDYLSEIDSFNSDKNKINNAINISANKYGVDKKLITSLIKQESNFDPNCVSHVGAIGLMQIMPNTIKKFNVKDPYDIYENIDAGTKHLKGMIERYEGDLVKAVAAYNCGGNALDKSGFQSLDDVSMLPKETRIHVTKVFYYYNNEF